MVNLVDVSTKKTDWFVTPRTEEFIPLMQNWMMELLSAKLAAMGVKAVVYQKNLRRMHHL